MRPLNPALLAILLAACAGSSPLLTPTPLEQAAPASTASPLPTLPLQTPTPLPTAAAPPEPIRLTGQFASAALAVYAQGDLAYLGLGARLAVLDVSDPAQPGLLGQTVPLPDFVQDVSVSQGYAYLAAGWGGLIVVDVRDPARPAAVGQLEGAYSVGGLALEGSTAYLATGEAGLLIVDVSNPSAPALLGSLDTPGSAEAVAVAGSTAFLAAREGGLWFVDVSDPAHPGGAALPELLDLSDSDVKLDYNLYDSLVIYDVALAGDLLYFATGDDGTSPFVKGLRALDVADPAHPLPVGTKLSYERASHLFVSDSLALYTDISGYPSTAFSLQVVDISNPADPEWVGSFGSDHELFDLFVEGTRAYLANGTKGLGLVDLADPSDPRLVGAYEPPPPISGYAAHVLTPYAYLADGESGLRIVDLSDRANPFSLSLFNTPGFAVDVSVYGRRAYVADEQGGLRLLDVTDPAHPRELSAPDSEVHITGVVVGDEYALARSSVGDLLALSLADAEQAVLQLVLEEADLRELHLSGGLGYAVTQSGGFQVIDLSDPLQPKVLGSLQPDGDVNGATAAGSNAYLATDDFGAYLEAGAPVGYLRVVDVRDPSRPQEVGFLRLPGFARAVAVSDSRVAVGDRSGWVYLIDVSSPVAPIEIAALYTPVIEVMDLDFAGSSLIVSGSGGAVILRLGEVPPLDLFAAQAPLPAPTPAQLASGLEFLEPPAALPEGTPDGSRVGITHVRMVTAEIGWGLGGLDGDGYAGLLRTTDGGHSWVDVTPPEPGLGKPARTHGFRSAQTFFWDQERAWIIYFDTPRVWRTGDGGRTWQASQPLPLAGTEEGDEFTDEYLGPMALQFIDLRNGWLAVNEAQGMMHGDLELLRTRDGGATWEHIHHGSILSFRGLAFLDERIGWISDGEAEFSAEALEQTHDGGRTWEVVTSLGGAPAESMFARCRALCPVQFLQVLPSRTAVMVVFRKAFDYEFEPPSALYVSADGGATWEERQLPESPTSLVLIDPQRGWLLDGYGGKLFATEDGGLGWTEVRQVGWDGRLNFISDRLGWAVAWPAEDGEPWYQDLEGRALLRTADGGRSWEQLQPRLVP